MKKTWFVKLWRKWNLVIVSLAYLCFTILIKNTIVFINLTWPSKTGLEFPTKVTFFGWIYYLHVVVCSLAKTNLGICNNLPAVNSWPLALLFWYPFLFSSFSFLWGFVDRWVTFVLYQSISTDKSISTSLFTRARIRIHREQQCF